MTDSTILVSYEEALERGLPIYSTGRPCRRGHPALRYTNSRNCVHCTRGLYHDGKTTSVFGKKKKPRIPLSEKRGEKRFAVYILKVNEFTKIGVAENLKARLMQVSVNCPYKPELIFSSPILSYDRARELEVKLLKAFECPAARGEWVKANPRRVVFLLKELLDL